MQNNNTLDFKRLLGFNQLPAIAEPGEVIENIGRLSNKIGQGEERISRVNYSESHKNLERLFNKISELEFQQTFISL